MRRAKSGSEHSNLSGRRTGHVRKEENMCDRKMSEQEYEEDCSFEEERFRLVLERIREIAGTEEISDPITGTKEELSDEKKALFYSDFFRRTAGFILTVVQYGEERRSGRFEELSLERLQEYNEKLYGDITGGAYERSYANPAYAAGRLGTGMGRLLSCLYMEIRGMIVYAAEDRLLDMTICCEIFMEVFCILEDGGGEPEVQKALYYFFSDYCDVTVDYRNRELLDPELSFARDIVTDSNLEDLRYLYRYGEYVSENELETARYLNSLPEETITAMAATYTEGYRKGFELAHVDLSKKEFVDVRYCLGFERVVRKAVDQFEKLGLRSVLYRSPVNLMNRRDNIKIGYYGTSPSQQCDYDHRCDLGLFLNGDLKERKLSVMRTAFEKRKSLAAGMAGPAVMEIFGEENFTPVNKTEAAFYEDWQLKLLVQMQQEAARITYQYINGEERSFTIISYPVPAIGKDFEKIFDETIRLNNLDYELYGQVQERIIQALDQCDQVEIKGREGNETSLTVALRELEDPLAQTKFENCLADVNIPLGEVFTSPVLKETEGRLHVKELYIEGVYYKDIWFQVKDGMVEEYGCGSFSTEEEGKALVRETILHHHRTLPIGEFAIGTNTAAYRMAKKYGIFDKLKILIAEKTGPHFAFGDTCYSNGEERRVYNPDGKEIVAKDNEISILRKTNPKEAYFGCHTDITLPYDELDTITGIRADGSRIEIVKGGRFVLPGTEELNKEL